MFATNVARFGGTRPRLVAASALVCCVMASAAVCGAAPQVSTSSGFVDATNMASAHGKELALLNALHSGNAVAVDRLADELQLNPIARRLLRAQLDYDMPAALAEAKLCRTAALKKHRLSAAERCNAIAFGAARVLGDAKKMLHTLAWDSASASIHPVGNAGAAYAELAHADRSKLADSISPLKVTRVPGRAFVPVVNWAKGTSGDSTDAQATRPWAQPQVDIHINGQPLHADVDTGTAWPLVIDTSHAKGLGIRSLVTGFTPVPTLVSPQPKPGTAELGLVSTFVFGPLIMHNLAVHVVPDGFAGDGVLIGLPVLARLHRITFTSDGIIVDGSWKLCSQPLSLTYAASGTTLIGALVFKAKADDRPIVATFDSGSSSLLAASPTLAREVGAPQPTHATTETRIGYLAVDVGSGYIESYGAEFLPWLPDHQDVLIGAPVLASADVTLAFSPPTLCIVPKSTH